MKKILTFLITIVSIWGVGTHLTHAQINTTQGGTGLSSFTAGDMLYYSSGFKLTRIGIGSEGNCLTISGGIPAWSSCASGSGDITAVGDVTSGDAFTGTAGTQLTFDNAGGDGILAYDGTDFTFDKSLRLGGATGGRISASSGIFTLLGLSGTNENLTIGLSTNNTANIGTGTGVSNININDSMNLTGTSSRWLLSGASSSYFGNGTGAILRTGFGGVTSPGAKIHIGAGATGALTAPIKLTAGTNMTTPEEGAIEFDGTSLFYTDSTPTRRTLAHLANKLSAFASTTSAELAGVISDETGTGALVFADTPTFTTRINVPDVRATNSGGLLIEASNGTDIGLLGAGNTANVTWYGSHVFDALTASKVAIFGRTKNLISDTGSDLTVSGTAVSVVSASDTTAGKVELATTAETNTGTDATRAVTPDGLSESYAGIKNVTIMAINGAVTTGTGKVYFTIPQELNGMDLIQAQATLIAPSTSGTPEFDIFRGRQSTPTTAHNFVDVLSTNITIDVNEYDSKDATTARVINTSNDDVQTADVYRIDVVTAGTGSNTLLIRLSFRLP